MKSKSTETLMEGMQTSLRQILFPLDWNRRRMIDLGLLYMSKSGSVAVGILIMPLFNSLLGADLFGVIALILSLQALLLMLDFGMAVLVGRELASTESTPLQRYTIWRGAEWAISLIYAFCTPPTLLIAWFLGGRFGVPEVFACIGLFWALTLQNIGQNALLARQYYVEAATIQILGLLARHGLTAILLIQLTPTLSCFIYSQLAVAVVQMFITRWRCIGELRPRLLRIEIIEISTTGTNLLRTGRSLMLFSMAGAAVLQLDKVIVSSLISPRELGPYFLAATFCMTPITVFAAPVAQFFQPRLVRSFSSNDWIEKNRTIKQFVGTIAVCTLLPAGLIWQFREELVAFWLGNVPAASQVASYSAVLLPGVALGAMGYVPYTLLIARKDYLFQAQYSAVLTFVTLTTVLLIAIRGSVLAICIIYALYHSVSTIGSWWRCIHLDIDEGRPSHTGARLTVISIFLAFGSTLFLAAFANKFNLFK